MSPHSTLYVRLPNWVGDVCMSLPSLALLAATGAPLVVCARPWARDLLAGMPAHGFVPMTGKVWADARAVRRQRRHDEGPARGLLLPDSLSSAAVFRLAGIPSAGYRDDGRSVLLRWPIDKPQLPVHAVESWYGLTRRALTHWALPAGSASPAKTLGLPLTEAHRAQADAAVEQWTSTAQPLVLIAPTAVGLHKGRVKVWPHFDALTQRLQARGVVVAMCPPPAEQAQARANAPTATLLPPMSLGAFAALTTRVSLTICNDSGVSHLAAAADAPQLTLFGVTRPARTGPWSPRAVCVGAEDAWPTLDEVVQRALTLLNLPQ